MGLNNLGTMLGELGRHEEAIDATREAAEIRRRLSHERPDVFGLQFAETLSNLASRRVDLGDYEEALHFARETVLGALIHASPALSRCGL